MAYVPGFKHDIFLSYASVNDLKPEDNKIGWVSNFRVKLEKELICRIGNGIEIWMDKKDIAIGDEFKNKIIGGVESSAILLIILSERYLKSEWCRVEREVFLKQINKVKMSDIDGVSGLKRIFVVWFEDVNRLKVDIPSELKGLQKIDFFRKDENKKVYTLGWPQLLENDPYYLKYTNTLTDLSWDLGKRLKELKSNNKVSIDTTAKKRSLYEKMMKECHGLIVIYGESDERWVTLVLEKSVTMSRNKPLEAGAIIQAPPPADNNDGKWLPFKPGFMRKIDCINHFNKNELKIFFSDVKKSFEKYNNKNNSFGNSADLGAIVFVNAIGKDRGLAKKICKMADEDYGMTYYYSP